jgi:WD40 repeat protein
MPGSHREPADSTPAGSRAWAGRYRRSRIPAAALISAMAIVAISGIAFAADNHLLTQGNSQAATASRKLCGSPYRPPKPIARQFTFHDPNSRGTRGLAFCSNSSYLAAADGNGHVYVWSMATHRIVVTLHDPGSKGVNAVGYRPQTRTLAAADADGSVYLWQPGRARPRRLADHASKGVRALAFSPDGTLLAAADGNGHAYIWSMRTDRMVTVLRDAGSRGIAAVAFSSDGKALATGDANGWTYAWTLSRTHKARLQAKLHDAGSKGVRAVAFRPRTRIIAIADANGRDYVWVPGAKGRPGTLTDPASKGINAEVFTPNGGVLATGDAVGRVYFWGFSILKVVEFYPASRVREIRAVAISPDRRRAAAGAANGTIYIADVTSIGISASFAAVGASHGGG